MHHYRLVLGGRNRSSWSLRGWLPLCLLESAGIIDGFTEIKIDWQNPDRKQEIIEKGGGAEKVPVLFAGEDVIWEAWVIGEYLAGHHPEGGLLPDDEQALWMGRVLCAEMHSSFPHLRKHCPMDMLAPLQNTPMDEGLAADIARINQLWGFCFRQFSATFLLGDTLSLCDIMFAPVVSRFVTYQIATPHQRYVQAVMQHPAMQKWMNLARDEAS